MLYSRRKRQEALAREEAAGASFWTAKFEEPARVKLWHAFSDTSDEWIIETASHARNLICREEGRFYLTDARRVASEDFAQYLLTCPDEMVPTCIEAMRQALLERAKGSWQFQDSLTAFSDGVKVILREHRISFDLIEGQMVEFASQEIHNAVVEPTLRLLSGRRGFEGAEKAYKEALEEISHGKPADAITDAGTALQETLTSLGCEGNALGPLTKSARKKGLLAPHDGPMTEAVEKLMHWVSADRSTTGDAHGATSPSTEDAWLIVHLVGALVLRLAAGLPR
ncbi:hypothetical protein [Modestobacter sp. SYSU DS0290]